MMEGDITQNIVPQGNVRRIKLTVAYDGTRYSGWQVQKNAMTVEQALNEAIGCLTKEKIQIIGASRTDAGVHSYGNVAVFDTASRIPAEKFTFALNSHLPEDIRVLASEEAAPDFHPRKCNSAKTYEYRIWNSPVENPVGRLYADFEYTPLDVGAMREAAGHLVGEHDFQSFTSAGNQTEETIRTIYSLEVLEQEPAPEETQSHLQKSHLYRPRNILIRVRGNGFLYNMVRIIVGTLIDVGKGRLTPGQVKEILEARNRQEAGRTAPAKGLALVGIEYEEKLQDSLIVKTEHWSYGIWQREIPLSGDAWLYLHSCDEQDIERNLARLMKKSIRDGAAYVWVSFGEDCGKLYGRKIEGFWKNHCPRMALPGKSLPEEALKCFRQAFGKVIV